MSGLQSGTAPLPPGAPARVRGRATGGLVKGECGLQTVDKAAGYANNSLSVTERSEQGGRWAACVLMCKHQKGSVRAAD